MDLPNFGDFLDSISKEDSEAFAEAFNSGYQESGLGSAQVSLTLRILAAYHEWLSKSLQEKK